MKKNIDDPIFIGGFRRSGTSLVRSRISSHRKISANLKLNENIISKYCDLKSWKL